ncbi:hypothetical protein EES38_20320 [Vibrio viridaestus]|uniref:Uncharacterized protein n=1 Tax=Vibrio viridaestus TaxID=2487322 RepID=A0A3N9TAR1_9VIBR|nr:hypothetical protein EES38_20320 [Vibrio viridaestus]
MQSIDRVTIYSCLSFICLCALLFRTEHVLSLLPIFGLLASILGIALEVKFWRDVCEDNQNP